MPSLSLSSKLKLLHSMLNNPEQILDDIIFEIQSVSEACRWYIRIERLAELLTISKEDFFRKIYNFKTSKPDRETRNGFSEIDGDYLCEFLHYCLDIHSVQDKFAQAGLYFDERALYELRENFKFIVQDSLSKHNLDKETLMLLATATLDFDDAIDSYISEKFELEFFVQRSIFDFMSMRKIQTEGGAEIFLKDYLNALIPTKILNLREITREFRDRSYYDLFGEFRKRPSKKKKVIKRQNKELTELINYFDMEEGFTKETLKKKFKELLKKYHPDVNKFGLEKTKEIIEKYNRLVIIMNDTRINSY